MHCSIDIKRVSQTAGRGLLESAGEAEVLVEGIILRLPA